MVKFRKIFLGGLAGYFQEQELYNMFKSLNFTSILKIDLIKSKKDPKINAGFGFMLVQCPKEAIKILKIHQFELNNRMFVAKDYKRGNDLDDFQDEVQKRRVFVHTIDPCKSNKEIKDFFGKVVPIEDGYIIKKSGSKFNIGYLMAATLEGAKYLIKKKKFSFGNTTCIVTPYEKRLQAKEKKIQTYLKKKINGKRNTVTNSNNKTESNSPKYHNQKTRNYGFNREVRERNEPANGSIPAENIISGRPENLRCKGISHYKGKYEELLNRNLDHSWYNIRLNPGKKSPEYPAGNLPYHSNCLVTNIPNENHNLRNKNKNWTRFSQPKIQFQNSIKMTENSFRMRSQF